MFYDKILELYIEGEGHFNDRQIWVKGQLEPFKIIQCDIQPYSSELLKRDYGYDIKCTKRIFCDPDSELLLGMTVSDSHDTYKVVKIITWDDYWDVVLDG